MALYVHLLRGVVKNYFVRRDYTFRHISAGVHYLTVYGNVWPKVLIVRHLVCGRGASGRGIYYPRVVYTPPVYPIKPNGQNLGATWAQNQASFALFSPVCGCKGNRFSET